MVFEADRATRAGGSFAPALSGQVGPRLSRSHRSNGVFAAVAARTIPKSSYWGRESPLSWHSSSVPAAGNGPTHRFAQPRRSPLARTRPREKRIRDATSARAESTPPRFFFLFLPRRVPLSPSFLLPLPPPYAIFVSFSFFSFSSPFSSVLVCTHEIPRRAREGTELPRELIDATRRAGEPPPGEGWT